MTSPSLPNGFSTDFSEVPRDEAFLVYADGHAGIFRDFARYVDGTIWGSSGVLLEYCDPLCWCPIPTPGDDVLKQLAEGK